MRQSGILMPVSALPGAYGIGSFSKEAYKFVDWLQKAASHCGRFCHLARPVMGILLTSHFRLLLEILILLILKHWPGKDCLKMIYAGRQILVIIRIR